MFSCSVLTKIMALLLLSAITMLSAQGLSAQRVSAQGMDDSMSDPTQPLEYTAYSNQAEQFSYQYKVSQIYISKKTQFALINNQKVKVGDWLEGAEVVLIKPNRVHLLIGDTIKQISIMPSIKQY